MEPTAILTIIACSIALTPAMATACILIFWHPNRPKRPRPVHGFPVIMPNENAD